MAATSRERQRSLSGSLSRRKPPRGSVMRSRPATAVGPLGGPSPRRGGRVPDGTKPRLTSTTKPSSRPERREHPDSPSRRRSRPGPASAVGLEGAVEAESSVAVALGGDQRPFRRTGGGAGAAWTRASTRAIRSSFQARRSSCQTPSAAKPEKARTDASATAAEPRRSPPHSCAGFWPGGGTSLFSGVSCSPSGIGAML